jgi:hypothetical protein
VRGRVGEQDALRHRVAGDGVRRDEGGDGQEGDELDLRAGDPAEGGRQVGPGDQVANDGAHAQHPARPCGGLLLLRSGDGVYDDRPVHGLDSID